MKKLYFFILVILTIALISGCGSQSPTDNNKAKDTNGEVVKAVTIASKIKVVATFYPLYEFAVQTGGDRVDVYNLLPPGAEPHSWEPTPKDMARIEQADLFIYNGAGLEPWVEQRLLPILANSKVKVINASEGQNLITATGDDHEHGEEHKHSAEAGYDPHFWLDPMMARQAVETIASALCEIDLVGKQYYREKAVSYGEKLLALDKEFSTAALEFKSKDLVTSHDAFAYLSRRYGLQQVSVLGLSPESQPSPSQLKDVVEFVRNNHVRCIFFEPLVSSRLSETVASEAKVKTGVLNTVEGLTEEQKARGDNYISLMYSNLATLRGALQ